MSVFVCECAHSRPCSMQIQKASASFSCWFLCVTSSADPAWWSFYKTALFYSPFPFSACCRRCSCSLHSASQNSTCTHTQIPKRATLMCLSGSTSKHIEKSSCGVFTSACTHSCMQTNGKYTGKESTQEAVCWSCRG